MAGTFLSTLLAFEATMMTLMLVASINISLVMADTNSAIEPIVLRGKRLFGSNSKLPFYIKGVAYQPNPDGTFPDPISDDNISIWTKDLGILADLGVNTIRVYEVDPSLSHEKFMSALASYGMYLVLDLPASKVSIDRNQPSYDITIWNRLQSVVDAFIGYDNTLMFIVGNEVSDSPGPTTKAMPFVKASMRDIRAYIAESKKRDVPVGYATSDHPAIRQYILDYLICGTSEERSDFYAVNIYSWCGNSSFEQSGYKDRTAEIHDYPIAAWLSEFGCNLVRPRPFTEIGAIFGPQMTSDWCGGVIYEYTEEVNQYGLVDSQRSLLPDYFNAQTQLKQLSLPTTPTLDDYQAPVMPDSIACPAPTTDWLASSILPPKPDAKLCNDMVAQAKCIANPNLAVDQVATRLGNLCGMVECDAWIGGDGAAGKYAKYSGCATIDKLTWAFNEYYNKRGTGSVADCSWNGDAWLRDGGNGFVNATPGPAGPVQSLPSPSPSPFSNSTTPHSSPSPSPSSSSTTSASPQPSSPSSPSPSPHSHSSNGGNQSSDSSVLIAEEFSFTSLYILTMLVAIVNF